MWLAPSTCIDQNLYDGALPLFCGQLKRRQVRHLRRFVIAIGVNVRFCLDENLYHGIKAAINCSTKYSPGVPGHIGVCTCVKKGSCNGVISVIYGDVKRR